LTTAGTSLTIAGTITELAILLDNSRHKLNSLLFSLTIVGIATELAS
jgi:hypothetical protein